jgi:archaellum component FlaD/FlaE
LPSEEVIDKMMKFKRGSGGDEDDEEAQGVDKD